MRQIGLTRAIASTLLLLAMLACEDLEDARTTTSGVDYEVDRLADEPVPITGSHLRCQYIAQENTQDIRSVGCNPYDNNRNDMIDLDLVAVNVEWATSSELEVSLTTNYFDENNQRWQAKFDFAIGNLENANNLVLETLITLTFTYRNNNRTVEISDRIRNILQELAAYRYVKIVYQSIHMNPPADSAELPDTVSFEFKVDGSWEQILVAPQDIDFLGQSFRSNRFQLNFTGSTIDWYMFIMSGLGQTLADALGNAGAQLSWNTHNGELWMFADGSSFESQSPFDINAAAPPVELIVDMGGKHVFSGLRLDQGQANPGRQLPNGFPNQFYFMVSEDRDLWRRIMNSEISIADRSQPMSWEWD